VTPWCCAGGACPLGTGERHCRASAARCSMWWIGAALPGQGLLAGWAMTPKRWALVLLMASCLAVCAFAAYMRPRPSAINEENVAKIKRGMALAEVEAILGGPARDESHGRASPLYQTIGLVATPLGAYPSKEWISTEAAVEVEFGDDEVVMTSTRGVIRWHPEVSLLETVRRWFQN
jgi:hypothetical protein